MANTQTTVPLFVANQVLTASQQNLSAGTGVPVFATTVTRDAAFGGSNKALAEGQLAYIEASNIVQYYDGAAWATVGPSASKIAQVIIGSTSTQVTSTSSSLTDTGLTATITPTLNTSKVLVMVTQNGCSKTVTDSGNAVLMVLLRGATAIATGHASGFFMGAQYTNTTTVLTGGTHAINWLDSPATTSATTYKTQFKPNTSPNAVSVQSNQLDTAVNMSSIILMEVLA